MTVAMLSGVAAVAIALAALLAGWVPGSGFRVWGRRGRELGAILGKRVGLRGSVYVNRDEAMMAWVRVRERGWRGVVKLVEQHPDLLYPLPPEKARLLLEKLPESTAKRLIRVYRARYPRSRIARIYRRALYARLRAIRARLAAAEDTGICGYVYTGSAWGAVGLEPEEDEGPPPVLEKLGVTEDLLIEDIAYRCGLLTREAEEVYRRAKRDLHYCSDEECVMATLMRHCDEWLAEHGEA